MDLNITIIVVSTIFILLAVAFTVFQNKLYNYRLEQQKLKHADELIAAIDDMRAKYDEVENKFNFRLDYLSRHMETEIAKTSGINRNVKTHLISALRRLSDEEIARGADATS